MNSRAQGALEYLLLIGGAVLIAAIVLTLLSNIGQSQQGITTSRVNAAQCEPLDQTRCTDPAWANFDTSNDTVAAGVTTKTADCQWNDVTKTPALKCVPK